MKPLASLAFLFAAACAPEAAAPGGSSRDAGPPAPFDFSANASDLTRGPLSVSGGPCASQIECFPGILPGLPHPTCTRGGSMPGVKAEFQPWADILSWQAGYCQSPCDPKNSDANGMNVTDCTGRAPVCVGSPAGWCYAGCESVADCRDGYVCASISGNPASICVPVGASSCDPPGDPRPRLNGCDLGQQCHSLSPDGSFGQCVDSCSPVEQDCPPARVGAHGCVVQLDSVNGRGDCLTIDEYNTEGAACASPRGCPAGMMCYRQKCRQYCRTPGGVGGPRGCPQGQACRDITVPGTVVQFQANQTGVCTP